MAVKANILKLLVFAGLMIGGAAPALASQNDIVSALPVLVDDDIDRAPILKAVPAAVKKAIPTPRKRTALHSPKATPARQISMIAVPLPRMRPEKFAFMAPVITTGLLSAQDRRHYEKAFEFLSRRQWKKALAHADKATYQLPAQYIRWSWLRAYKGGASFEEISSFAINNPDWPYRSTLMRRAEEALINPIAKDRMLVWFTDRTPVSGMGMLRYGEALLADGQTDKGQRWIRKAWVEGNFSKSIEKKFLKNHKGLLTKADHQRRLDRLLWDRRTSDAVRMLGRVTIDQKRLAVARIRLMRMSRNVDAAIRKVPAELQNDPGFLFDRTKWRRRKGKHEAAQKILLQLDETVPNPEIWWPERDIQARKLLRKGYITNAYKLASQNGMSSGGRFATAEWLAGWIALRFLNDYDIALSHFTRLYENVKFPISRARGAYWIARTHAAMKDTSSAAYWYEEATRYSSTFYGQLAMAELNLSSIPDLKAPHSVGTDITLRMDNSEQVKLISLLAELGQQKRARPFLLKLTEDATNPQEYVYLGQLARKIARPDYSVAVAKRASQLGTELPDISWPVLSFSVSRSPIEMPLVMAITRQESAFATDARSEAGARGLMQLMPSTARSVSRKLKLSYSKRKLTRDPAYNTLLGSTYLRSLIDKYNGSYVLAIASYNAGSSRVRSWIRDFGDPRTGEISVIDWIELIPYNETRNYVQRVMENLQIYRQLLGEQNYRVVQISTDLSRGNSIN